MKNSYNFHHILPTSLGGSNIVDNKVKLDVRHHQALHMLFNNSGPVDQIRRLMSINSTALTEEIKEDINKILKKSKDPEYVFVK